MIYGQLSGCESLRELVCIMTAHSKKSYHLGFGKSLIKCSNPANANVNGDCKILRNLPIR
jgi:hypothetical protein